MTTTAGKMTAAEMAALYDAAQQAGRAMVGQTVVTPMLVGQPTTPLGSDIDYRKPTYVVSDGACGFAWVTIRPGFSRFAKWLVTTGRGRKAYGGGVSIWIGDYNQSVQKKAAHADAMAAHLRAAGIEAHAESRLD